MEAGLHPELADCRRVRFDVPDGVRPPGPPTLGQGPGGLRVGRLAQAVKRVPHPKVAGKEGVGGR
jgi:hypothetical protein